MEKLAFCAWLLAGVLMAYWVWNGILIGLGAVGVVWDLYRRRPRSGTLPLPLEVPEERRSGPAIATTAYIWGRLTPEGQADCLRIEHAWECLPAGARPGWTLLWPRGMFVYIHSDGRCSFSLDGKMLDLVGVEPDRVLTELAAIGMAHAAELRAWRYL